MSGSGHRRTSKWDLEENPRHLHGDPIGPGPERPSNRESQTRWHSREGNYKVARDSLEDTMVWDEESTMSPGLDDWRQQKRKYSFESSRGRSHRSRSRSRSQSPGHRLERPGFNDRVGRVASFDHRNHEPRRSDTVPCKFFASGNCRNGKACRFSHNDQTRDSYNKYGPDEYRQGVDSRVNMAPLREGSKWCGSAPDLDLPKRYGNKNEGLGKRRAMGSTVDGSAPRDNRFMARQLDIDEVTTYNKSDDLRLTKHSSCGMGASESRGTAILGDNIEGSSTYTGDQLPLIGTSGKPDVPNTVRSEATSSNQCLMSTEQFSDLTHSLARFFDDGKQLPELYAALNASNALGFLQSSVAGSAGPDVPASSSSQYDPVNDSMELIKSVISEQPDKIALPSHLTLTGEPTGGGLYGTRCKDVEVNTSSHQSSENLKFADCENEEHIMVKATEIKEEHTMVKATEIKEEQHGGKISDEGDDEADEKKKNNDGKCLRAFKFALAEFVKELLKPTWKAGQISKEAHKNIVKKVVNKVTSSVQGVHIPQTQEKIDNYLSAYKPKLSKLVQAYVDKLQKE